MTDASAGPRPALHEVEAPKALTLWEPYDEAARSVAITAGLYIEAMEAAGQDRVASYWRVLVKRTAEFQAVRVALGLTDPKGPTP